MAKNNPLGRGSFIWDEHIALIFMIGLSCLNISVTLESNDFDKIM